MIFTLMSVEFGFQNLECRRETDFFTLPKVYCMTTNIFHTNTWEHYILQNGPLDVFPRIQSLLQLFRDSDQVREIEQ